MLNDSYLYIVYIKVHYYKTFKNHPKVD